MESDASKYCQSLFWKWESECRRADSPTGMSSYSPMAIIREPNFCQGVTFAKCTSWTLSFWLLRAQTFQRAELVLLGPFCRLKGNSKKFWILKNNPVMWFISTKATENFAELTKSACSWWQDLGCCWNCRRLFLAAMPEQQNSRRRRSVNATKFLNKSL